MAGACSTHPHCILVKFKDGPVDSDNHDGQSRITPPPPIRPLTMGRSNSHHNSFIAFFPSSFEQPECESPRGILSPKVKGSKSHSQKVARPVLLLCKNTHTRGTASSALNIRDNLAQHCCAFFRLLCMAWVLLLSM